MVSKAREGEYFLRREKVSSELGWLLSASHNIQPPMHP